MALTRPRPMSAYLPETDPSDRFARDFERDRAEGFEGAIQTRLIKWGIPPRLRKAGPDLIPEAIRALGCWREFPSRPFGLVGAGGTGKSCALIYAIKECLRREFEEAGPTRVDEPNYPFEGAAIIKAKPRTSFRWIAWPEKAIEVKNLASRRDWENPDSTLLPIIDWVKDDPENNVLILDDLGMENVKADSYTSEQLELLIDTIYNYESRLFWTANKSVEELTKPTAYGYRLMSRLCGAAPDAGLPDDLPDLRVKSVQ